MFIPTADPKKDLRLPLIGFLPNKIRNHFIAMMAEFVGTFMFLFFSFSATQVANASAPMTSGDSGLTQVPNVAILLYISLAFGFSLAVNAWVFFRVSGGLFNPAVTLGMAVIGAVGWMRALLVLISQLLGSMASAAVVSALFPGPLNVSTTLSHSTSLAQGVFIEMFLTAQLVFTIFMLAAEKHKGTFIAPVGIGLSLFIAELSGVFFTGGSLNPARSFGPCVVNREFPVYHWIYWVGPCLGSLIAAGFYRFCKVLEFETANPGQDFDDKEDEAFEFNEDHAATGAHVQRPVHGIPVAKGNMNRQQSGETRQERRSSNDVERRSSRRRSGSNRPGSSDERGYQGASRTERGNVRRSVQASGR